MKKFLQKGLRGLQQMRRRFAALRLGWSCPAVAKLPRFRRCKPLWQKSLRSPLLHRSGRFLAIAVITFILALSFNGTSFWSIAPATAQTTNLYIEPLTWDFVGLDSNNVNVGPNTFLNGSRICNVGSTVATNVTAQFVREGATNPYISVRALAQGRSDTVTIPQLQPGSIPPNHHQVSGTPANCFDAYFNVVVARNAGAYNTVQKYRIEAGATNAGIVRTPINRQIYVEKILSQARNAVQSFTGPTSVFVGDTVTYTLTAKTATAYPQLTISSDFPNAVFQFLNISTTYSNPGGSNSSIYADACGWIADYTATGYRQSSSVCDGPVPDQYAGGKVGETVVTQYTIKILSTGNGSASNTFNVNHLILDFSGGSYHYNSDYGIGIGAATITVSDRQADLSISKTHSGNFSTGNNTYTLAVRNNGNTTGADSTAKGALTVTDTLPTGFSYVGIAAGTSAGWTCSANGQIVTCTNPNDLANGATSTIQLQVNVSSSAAATSVNTATVQGSSTDPNLNNNTSSDPTLIVQGANLRLTKSDGSPSPTDNQPLRTVGQTVNYTFTVQNQSATAAAAPIVLTDTLPTGLTFGAFSGTNWSCSAEGQNVTCTYNQTLSGNSTTSTLTLVVNTNSSAITSGTSAIVTNTATVNSSTFDPSLADNTSSDNLTLSLPVPDLTISKTHNSNFVQNSNGQYTITVTNNGVATTTGAITVTETLPSALGMSYQAHSGIGSTGAPITWTCQAGAVTCAVGSTGTLTFAYPGPLAPGQSSQLILTVIPTTAGTNINNTVSVSTPGDGSTQTKTASDPTTVVADPGNSATIALVAQKKLTLVNGVAVTCTTTGQQDVCPALNPGDTVRYVITITNNTNQGPDTATFTPTDVVPAAINVTSWSCSVIGGSGSGTNSCAPTSSSGNTINPNITLRKGGGTATITVDGTLTTNAATLGSTTSLTNTVSVPSQIGTDIDDVPVDNIYSVTTPINRTSLSVSKTDNNVDFTVGVPGTYSITVTNTSANPTIGTITVTDDLPNSFNFVYGASGANSSGWNCILTDATNKIVTCTNAGPLAAGQVSKIDLVVTPTTSTGSPFTNTVTAATPGATTVNGSDTTTVTTPSVDLQITKSVVGGGSFAVGQSGSYQLSVVNLGPTVATGSAGAPIRVTDTLPTGLSFVSASGAGWTCSASGQTVTCDRTSNLGVNQPSTVTINALVDLTAPSSLSNTAQVNQHPNESAANYVLNNNSSNSRNNSTVTTAVNAQADLAIVKTLSGNLVAGQNALYQLQVSNNGPSSVSSAMTITDTLQSGLTFVSGSGGGFTCSASGQTVTCTNSNGLAVGTTATINLTVTVAASATGTIANSATVSSGVADPIAGNNTSSTGALTVSPRQADLGLTKTHSGTFAIGGQGTFTLEVKNYGPATVTGAITVTDTLPNALTLASFVGQDWSCTGVGSANTTCTYSNPSGLVPNSTTAVDLTVNIGIGTPTSGSITNTATVSSSIPEPAPDTRSNTATDTVTVQTSADLAISKTSTSSFVVGNTATYTLQVRNNGAGSAAAPITLDEQLPTGLTYLSATSSDTNWSCPASSTSPDFACTYNAALAAGSSTGNLLLTVNVVDLGASTPSTYTNVATVYSPTQDPNSANNTASLTTPRSAAGASRDFGDAPDTYGTDAIAGNSGTDPVGASHLIGTTVFMGSIAPDAESSASLPLNGTGDDVTGVDDEDGIASFPTLSLTTTSYSVSVSVTNTSGSSAALLGWLDFNRDGVFQSSEGVSLAVATGVSQTPVSLTWNNLGSAGMTAGTTYARFRLTTDGSVTVSTPGGQNGAGEVEDYPVTIINAAAAPPRVLLVKRVTAIRGIARTEYIDVTAGTGAADDNASNWANSTQTATQAPGTGTTTNFSALLQGVTSTTALPVSEQPKPGDEVEYTIYFLSDGGKDAANVQLCDFVSANSTYVPGTLQLKIGTSDSISITDEIGDTDGGYYTTGFPGACNSTNNGRGAVFVSIGTVDRATGSGVPVTSYGYIRFRAKID
ncbi:MAG: beta strand repeat-containing protein [Stenomitos frigidus ULC029]